MKPQRVWVATVVGSLVVAATALLLVVWIVAEPQYWFPGAYAQQGERGPRGDAGHPGPWGPPGNVGPDAEDAVAELTARIETIDSELSDLAERIGTSQLESDITELEASAEDHESRITGVESVVSDLASEVGDVQSGVADLQSTVEGLCSQLSVSSGVLLEIYFNAC